MPQTWSQTSWPKWTSEGNWGKAAERMKNRGKSDKPHQIKWVSDTIFILNVKTDLKMLCKFLKSWYPVLSEMMGRKY